MANDKIMLSFLSVFFLLLLPQLITALSSCGGSCGDLNDCQGQLVCIEGRCDDDPDVGTQFCSGGGSGSPDEDQSGDQCQPSGELTCSGTTYQTYTCSPPVTSSTAARLTNNNFEEGGDGGSQSECDGQYHSNNERIVALSTGWFDGRSRCGMTIRITANNGRSTTATVVDECDSMRGCDAEHAFQGPCQNNIVDASIAVWNDLGLDVDAGVVDVTWSMA